RGEHLAARGREVGLEQVAERGRAGGGEARDDAAAAGVQLERVASDADARAPAAAVEERAQAVAVEVRDHPARQRQADPDLVGLPGAVVRAPEPDVAGGLRLPRLGRERAQAALRERDRPLERARRKLAARRGEVPGRPAEVALDRAPVLADDRAHVDEALVTPTPGG